MKRHLKLSSGWQNANKKWVHMFITILTFLLLVNGRKFDDKITLDPVRGRDQEDFSQSPSKKSSLSGSVIVTILLLFCTIMWVAIVGAITAVTLLTDKARLDDKMIFVDL